MWLGARIAYDVILGELRPQLNYNFNPYDNLPSTYGAHYQLQYQINTLHTPYSMSSTYQMYHPNANDTRRKGARKKANNEK